MLAFLASMAVTIVLVTMMLVVVPTFLVSMAVVVPTFFVGVAVVVPAFLVGVAVVVPAFLVSMVVAVAPGGSRRGFERDAVFGEFMDVGLGVAFELFAARVAAEIDPALAVVGVNLPFDVLSADGTQGLRQWRFGKGNAGVFHLRDQSSGVLEKRFDASRTAEVDALAVNIGEDLAVDHPTHHRAVGLKAHGLSRL